MTRRYSGNAADSDDAVNRRDLLKATGGVGAIGLTGLAGCLGGGNGDGDGGGEDDGPDGDGETSRLDGDSEPDKPDSITVRAWGGVWQESLQSSVGDPFTEETGIDVTYDNSDIQVTANNIRSAVNQDREPPVNVNWSIVVFVHRAFRQGLTAPLSPEVVGNLDRMRGMAKPDVEGDLPYVGLYSYTYALCYNEEALESVEGSPDPVSSWDALTESQYEDWVGIYNDPPGDGLYPVLAELADVELGPADELDPMWEYLEEWKPSVGFLGTDASLLQNLREGEIAYAAGYLPNNVLQPKEEGEPLGWTVPEEGATVRMDCMYTPKNQTESELYWSQKFVDFALQRERQRDWMEGLQVPMLNDEVEPLEWMEGDPAFPTTDEEFDALLETDLDRYTEYSPEWFDRFSQVIS
ncbi:MAG: substrate-binding domain-containing protein [Haloferacaceae archaeon]